MTWLARLLCVTAVMCPSLAWAQVGDRPSHEFPEFRGTWVLDETAGAGRIAAVPIPRTLAIATTPTEISLTKDSAAAEIYRLDGSETQLRDFHTGAPLDRTHRFTLVAGALALTHTSTRTEAGGPRQSNRRLTTIITDAYSVAGDVLTVERQHSVLLEPPGHLVTLMNPGNNRQTIVYRRATLTNAR